MEPFVVRQDTPLPPVAAWARLTDWPRHGRWVPLTAMSVDGGPGVGQVFTARTAFGPVGFDDPMEVVEWQPPTATTAGRCRLEKRGRVMLGWAELVVEPASPGSAAAGSRVTWTEAARPAHSPGALDPVTRAASRLLFGRVLRNLLAQ